MFPAENLAGEDQESTAQASRHQREGQDEIVKTENLQISLASRTSPNIQAREQVLSELGVQSELDKIIIFNNNNQRVFQQ